MLFVAGLAYLGLRHYVWPRLDDWRPRLEARLSEAAGRPVSVGRVRTGFDGLLPRLTLETVRIEGDDGATLLAADSVTAVISPRTLFAGEPRLALLEIMSLQLTVERVSPGLLRVAGVEVPLEGDEAGSALESLTGQRRIVLRGAVVDWRDAVLGVQRRLSGIDASIGSVGRRHRVSVDAAAHEELWGGLRFAAEVYRPPGREPGEWRRWSGEAYLELDATDAAAVAQAFPFWSMPLQGARGELKAWLDFDDGRAVRLDLKARVRDFGWRLASGSLRLAELEAELSAIEAGAGRDLRIQRLRVRDQAGLEFESLGEQRIRLDAAGAPVAGRLSAKAFDAGEALRFARRLPLDPEVLARLRALAVSGRVAAVSGQWDRSAALEFETAVDFEGLSLRYSPGAGPSADLPPWFGNLSGEARITQSGGELRVRASDATLAFPGLFAEPEIPLKSVLARASWVVGTRAQQDTGVGKAGRTAQGSSADTAAAPGLPPLEVEIAELRFENADAAGTVSGRWRSGGKGAGIIDLSGSFDRVRADRVARYVPLEIPGDVRAWVAEAIVGGRSDDVRFRVRGDLEDFPFERATDGEFSVDAQLKDTTLRYASGWPAIEGFDGRLLFERDGMRVTMRSGRVFGVALGETQAVIADFDTPLLVVEGGGEGPALDMIRFVNESPLATGIDDFTRDVDARGTARLQLRLDLPLDDLEATRVAGRVQFLGSSLTLDKTLPVFSGVTGALEFTERGLTLRDLSASFLGGPLRVEGETTEPGRFAIRGEGRIGVEGMRTIADNPITRALSGETGYRVRIDVNRRASSLSIESDLVGMASALPSPLAKREGESMPLLVETVAEPPTDPQARPRGDSIRVRLGERLALALERERDPGTEKLVVRRGALALDAEPVLPEAGLSVHLNAPEVDLDAWVPVFSGIELAGAGEAPTEGFAAGFQLLPQTVTVLAKRVRVAGQELNDVTLGASRAGGYWRANVGSREVQGYFSWRRAPQGQRMGTLTARFTRLELSRARAGEVESLLEASPQELPGLDVTVEEFVLFDRRLGALSLRATNSAGSARPVWTLEQLRIAHPSANFTARGTWATAAFGTGRTTRLDFDLDLVDSGRLLDVFGLEDVMTGGAGRISGDLHWRGSPMAFDYPTLGGSMSLKLGKGRFLKTDPGIAKLIGVLNLQSLPRRLALDFSDVFAEGFAFDEIAGDVGIAGGVARTEDLVMRGLQARVNIHGSANIEEETQDLEVEVRPELNAGLASLAYGAMVSPVIGIGSFVAQMALRGPIQQIFSYEYEITGPWDDPKVVEKRRRAAPAAAPPTGQ